MYQSELYALTEATTWIANSTPHGSSINFFTDSDSSLQAIQATHIHTKMAANLTQQLNLLGSQHRVKLNWVPGHEGVPGNERADALARAGTELPTDKNINIPLALANITGILSRTLFKQHIANYKSLNYSPKGKIPITAYLKSNKYALISSSTKDIRRLTWLLTGHSPLYYFQYVCNKRTSPDCAHCPEVPETSEHYICHCPKYDAARTTHLGPGILDMEDLMNLSISNICAFMEASGRFDQEDLFT